MMTITIAAITIGIAVDAAIHYVHRLKREFSRNSDYREGVMLCHGSIGRAIYYTSITVTVGFSVLTLSNFIPTIYFGFLTGIAMVVALLSNLTLLPLLIIVNNPLHSYLASGPRGLKTIINKGNKVKLLKSATTIAIPVRKPKYIVGIKLDKMSMENPTVTVIEV
jgi:hypothetical protein